MDVTFDPKVTVPTQLVLETTTPVSLIEYEPLVPQLIVVFPA
jgi:hypothetical protein